MKHDENLSKISKRMIDIDNEIATLKKQEHKLRDEKNQLITDYTIQNTRTVNSILEKLGD